MNGAPVVEHLRATSNHQLLRELAPISLCGCKHTTASPWRCPFKMMPMAVTGRSIGNAGGRQQASLHTTVCKGSSEAGGERRWEAGRNHRWLMETGEGENAAMALRDLSRNPKRLMRMCAPARFTCRWKDNASVLRQTWHATPQHVGAPPCREQAQPGAVSEMRCT